jgi:hypothetical protein
MSDTVVPQQGMDFTPKATLALNVGKIVEPQLESSSQPPPVSETVEPQLIGRSAAAIPATSTSTHARSPSFLIAITAGVTVCVLALGFIATRAWLNNNKGSNSLTAESTTTPATPTANTQPARLPFNNQYVTYHNSDFNYSIDYPANVLFPVPGSESVTGQRFSSKDGQSELSVVGIFNRPGETAEESYNATLADYSGKGRIVTYKVLRQDWHVISGFDGDRVFYEKTIFNSGLIKLFRFEWPESQRSIYEQITTRISKSFTG